MSIQVHTGEPVVARDIGVRLNQPGKPGTFAIIPLGPVELYVTTPADADRLIKAAVAAKDLLLAAGLVPCALMEAHFPHDRCPGIAGPALPEPECSACGATGDLAAVHDTGGDGSVLFYCDSREACQRRRVARTTAVTHG